MNNRIVLGIGVAAIALLIGIGVNYLGDRGKLISDNSDINVDENNIISESINIEEVTKVIDLIEIEDGYKSSIKQGLNDKDTLQINNYTWINEYHWNEYFSFEELIKSRNIAENFAQGIALYDSENPEKNINKVKKYASKDCEVRAMVYPFAWNGAKENTKEIQLENINSECFDYVLDSRRLYYIVTIYWNWIDNNNILVSKGFTDYVIGVEKIGEQFKIVEYYIK